MERSHWATASLELAGLLVDLAEVVVDGGVGVDALVGLAEVLFGEGVLAGLEVDPAERIEVGVVLGIELDGLLDHGEGFGELDAAVGEHVAEVVENGGVIGVDGEGLAELGFGLRRSASGGRRGFRGGRRRTSSRRDWTARGVGLVDGCQRLLCTG